MHRGNVQLEDLHLGADVVARGLVSLRRRHSGRHLHRLRVVDADGKVQMWSINNMDAGRSPAEVLRTSQATMAGGLCGANWKKGEEYVG